MKVKIEATITETREVEIPNYVKKDNDAIEGYLVDNYYGFENGLEGNATFNFERIIFL